jgi:hypothetical protein
LLTRNGDFLNQPTRPTSTPAWCDLSALRMRSKATHAPPEAARIREAFDALHTEMGVRMDCAALKIYMGWPILLSAEHFVKDCFRKVPCCGPDAQSS